MACLQWTIGGCGGLALPQLHSRRIRRAPSAVGHARAGLRQWGGKMEWKGAAGAERGRNGKGVEGDSIKAAASMSSGYDSLCTSRKFSECTHILPVLASCMLPSPGVGVSSIKLWMFCVISLFPLKA